MAKKGRPRKDPNDTVVGRAAMRAANRNAPRLGPPELMIYASGSGALSFVWQAYDHNRGSKIAIGRTVTMDDARTFMSQNRRGQELVRDGWKLWAGTGGGPMVVAPIERVGPDTIKMGDRVYRYHIDQTDPFYIRDGEIRQVSFSLEVIETAEEYELVPVTRTVKNVGTLATAAFFLNHEKALAQTPPEEFLYEVQGA